MSTCEWSPHNPQIFTTRQNLLLDVRWFKFSELSFLAVTREKRVWNALIVFFMDGTLKCSSKQFSQIYSIHADLGAQMSTPLFLQFFPVRRKRTTSDCFDWSFSLFRSGNQKEWTWILKWRLTIHEVLSSAQISGCFFHMKKCLWRKEHLGFHLSVEKMWKFFRR